MRRSLPFANIVQFSSDSSVLCISVSIFIKSYRISWPSILSGGFLSYLHVSNNHSENIMWYSCWLCEHTTHYIYCWHIAYFGLQLTYPKLAVSPFFWASVTASWCRSCLSSSDSACVRLGRVEAAADAAATSSGSSVSLKNSAETQVSWWRETKTCKLGQDMK